MSKGNYFSKIKIQAQYKFIETDFYILNFKHLGSLQQSYTFPFKIQKIQTNSIQRQTRRKVNMDFGGLDDILDDDIGYIPTAMKKQDRPKSRGNSLSRQNSTKSIGSLKDQKQDEYTPFNNNRNIDSFNGLNKQSPKSFNSKVNNFNNQQVSPNIQPRRNTTLFGLHKEGANNSNNKSPISFEDFFKNQNQQSIPSQPLSRPPLPQKKAERNNSFVNLSSPQNIIEDDVTVTSRRGRPPLNKRNQNLNSNQSQTLNQNRSQNYNSNTKGFFNIDTKSVRNQQFEPISISFPNSNNLKPKSPNKKGDDFNPTSMLQEQSLKDLKNIFTKQMQFQKTSMQALLKQQRLSHASQIQKLKSSHKQELQKKLSIKDFEIEKLKEFYEMQLKIYKEREQQIREYSTLNKKLESNISSIEKIQKQFKQNQLKFSRQKSESQRNHLEKKQIEIAKRQQEFKNKVKEFQQYQENYRKQKQDLLHSINQQKQRLYNLEADLRKKETELMSKHKKRERQLQQQYDKKISELEKQKDELKIQKISLNDQKNFLEMEKHELINAKKLWESQKKNNLQELHKQKTKVLERQIQLESRINQIEVKEQQIQMNQREYINKLKLLELQRKKIQIEKKSAKGQLYKDSTLNGGTGLKTMGFLGTKKFNNSKINPATTLQKEFYSNDDYQNEDFEAQNSYKKSVTEMRDEFLKSLPKFF